MSEIKKDLNKEELENVNGGRYLDRPDMQVPEHPESPIDIENEKIIIRPPRG